jgi:outer membrane lipoprotein-sorting protein
MRSLRSAAMSASTALAFVCTNSVAVAAIDSGPAPAPSLTSEQVVGKCLAARGGLEAWRKIETVIWSGHLETTRSSVASLPFVLEEKRPNKSRFEITAPSQRSVRVFDGIAGWKMHPGSDGRPKVERFTSQEVGFAREAPGFEGPLIHFQGTGVPVAFEGMEAIEGRNAYRLSLTSASGGRHKVWVDAQTFLEVRYDRTTSGPDGAVGTISVYYRDYRMVEGLAMPSLIEISGAVARKPDRMVIEKVALNPPLDDREFGGIGTLRDRTSATGGRPTLNAPPLSPQAGRPADPVQAPGGDSTGPGAAAK